MGGKRVHGDETMSVTYVIHSRVHATNMRVGFLQACRHHTRYSASRSSDDRLCSDVRGDGSDSRPSR